MIPGPHIVTIEEQFEAFFVWNWAREKELVPARGNRLQHFSRRPQMNAPRLGVDPAAIENGESSSYAYTCANIRNDTFIVAAAYHGFLEHCAWIKPNSKTAGALQTAYVYPALDTRNYPICHSEPPPADSGKCYSSLEFIPMSSVEACGIGEYSLINLSLDYFACHRRPKAQEGEIEITPQAYAELRENPHHILRLGFGASVATHAKNGRYFLSFYDFEHPVWERWIPSLEEIPDLIKAFFETHHQSISSASVVTLTRSVKSGHTPATHIDVIETCLRKELACFEGAKNFHVEELR